MALTKGTDSVVMVSRGVSYLSLQTVATSIAQALSFAILARIITPAEIGILAVLSLITGFWQAVNGLAFQQAAMKFIGEYEDRRSDLAAAVLVQTLLVTLVLSVPMASFTFLEAGFLSKTLLGTVSQAKLFRVLSLDILAYAGALPVTTGAVIGVKRFKAAATIGTGGAIFRQVMIIYLILLLKDFTGLVYAWALSDFLMFIGYGLYGFHALGLTRLPFSLRKLVTFSGPLTIGNLISFLYNWFDRAVLITAVPLVSLGVYNAALYAFGAVSNLSGAFSNTLIPVYSSIGAEGSLESCRRAMSLASRYISLVTVPLAFGLFATARPALTLFVGEAYRDGVVPLMILSLAFAFTSFGLALSPMLTALAKTREIMAITITSVALGLVSAQTMLPFLGIIGASTARGIATIASIILTMFVLKRSHALSIDFKMAWKTLVAGSVMAGVLLVTETIHYSNLYLLAYIIVGLVVYLLLLRFLKAIEIHDIDLIRRYVGTRFAPLASFLGVILLQKESVTK